MTMPAGKYYIGDLCYVLNQPGEWDEFCKLTITDEACLDGEFILPDGRRFATYSTVYGDGQYPDNQGNSYVVDAGLIGCILMSDIPSVSEQEAANCGAVVNFSHDFETGSHEGVIRFGSIRIDTSYDEFYEPEEFNEENDDVW